MSANCHILRKTGLLFVVTARDPDMSMIVSDRKGVAFFFSFFTFDFAFNINDCSMALEESAQRKTK